MMECTELNCLRKAAKQPSVKRQPSSQASLSINSFTELSKAQFFPHL